MILVGGQGTRLRPLTETIKKELLPLVDRPSLDHVLDHLVAHGIDRVVLSSSYLEDTFEPFLRARTSGPSITWITEREPLGTGGAIVHALPHVGDEPFLALNGDILTDLDLTAMVAFHRERAAAATIALHRVEDARPFGLVATAENARVLEFREKPEEPIPGQVNAGTYVLDPEALRRWPAGENVSIERDIFPRLIADGVAVLGFPSNAYWLDLGTPEKYLRAQADLLDGRVAGEPSWPAPFVDATASVDESAHVGRHVVVGARAVIESSSDVDESVLLEGARVEAGAVVRGSILGPRSRVGAKARIEGCVLAEDAAIEAGADVLEARVSAGGRAG